jgi:acid phosphatase class B
MPIFLAYSPKKEKVMTHDTFWDGMNRSLEEAMNDETYQIDNIDIKTQAGLKMFEYFNANYGSNVWGKVLEGIKAIEEELK